MLPSRRPRSNALRPRLPPGAGRSARGRSACRPISWDRRGLPRSRRAPGRSRGRRAKCVVPADRARARGAWGGPATDQMRSRAATCPRSGRRAPCDRRFAAALRADHRDAPARPVAVAAAPRGRKSPCGTGPHNRPPPPQNRRGARLPRFPRTRSRARCRRGPGRLPGRRLRPRSAPQRRYGVAPRFWRMARTRAPRAGQAPGRAARRGRQPHEAARR